MRVISINPVSNSRPGTLRVPGSKSYTNRSLLLAALSGRSVRIRQPLYSDDTAAMISCLRQLGVRITQTPTALTLRADFSKLPPTTYRLNARLSGTTIRFLLALATVIPGVQILRGHAGLNARPIKDLVTALRSLGAEIDYLGRDGYPPLRVRSDKLHGDSVSIKGSTSSQYLSALLMIAPLIKGRLDIKVVGQPVSKPYIAMTLATMKDFGVQVQNQNYQRYRLKGKQTYRAASYRVEGDASSAAYFWAIAALNHATITVQNLNPRSGQADMAFLGLLKQLGSTVSLAKDSITVTGHGVRPFKVDMQDCPDQVMSAAVLAAFAAGTSRISGIASLRVKETDRVAALVKELAKMKIRTRATADTLTIYGGQPRPARIATYGDHRLAMAFAIAATHLAGMEIMDPQVVDKTFPDFWEQLQRLPQRRGNIVLIGLRGSGKTTVGRQLAKRLGMDFIDMDAQIVKQAGRSIPELVSNRGWDYFRDQESAVAQALSLSDNKVIATGGGVVLRPSNIAALKTHGQVIWLKASLNSLVKRLGTSHRADRPALTGHATLPAELKQLDKERRKLYRQAADSIINTDQLSTRAVAAKIIKDRKAS